MGPWRIVDLRGRGSFGTVYLARGPRGTVALKLALAPREARFGREVALLSRTHHPAVPGLLAHGEWRADPESVPYPYLVMEWVEGVPLYVWAQARCPTSRQVLRLLARVARALEATHAAGGVHRDVKGDNVLVRLKDGQPFLIDFGAGSYQGADTLTWQALPPGTRAYRAPEAIRAVLPPVQVEKLPYAPGPADDVFALGVTAYRLVTGHYPPTADPLDEGAHVWREEGPGPQPARELNPRCAPELSGLISRMLAFHPEARGSAREVAKALERAARKAGREADVPLFEGRPVPPEPRWSWQPWLVAVGVAGPLVWGAARLLSRLSWEEAAPEQVAWHQEEARDAGTAAVGEAVLTAPAASSHAPFSSGPIALDMPSSPLPGQLRPDAKGRCPHKNYVSINGGCWTETKGDPKDCGDYTYEYKGACYQPVYPPQRPATSDPMESRDGG